VSKASDVIAETAALLKLAGLRDAYRAADAAPPRWPQLALEAFSRSRTRAYVTKAL
jgi:hypothetical protein